MSKSSSYSPLAAMQKHSTALWHIHANMAIATYTPTHRDATGVWQHSVHWPTREEAEGKYDRLNRPATVSTDI